MDLETRELGRSGLQITTVGLGAWAIGGSWIFGWGAQDDAESIETIKHAVSAGINWIDTAAIYGVGHSEEVVGRALAQIPASERPLVFTKCGEIGNPDRPFDEPLHSLEPVSIRRECEASLRRLGIERIDLYQFHWPDRDGVPVEDSWAEMGRLIDEGKIAHAGVCNFDIELLDRCEAIRHVDSLQPPFSMLRRDVARDLLPWVREHETGVICYGTMSHGLLTDEFSIERLDALADDDWRKRNWDRHETERNLRVRDALRPIAQRHGVSVAAVATRWVIEWPGVTASIVGARHPAQVDGWVGAATFRLTPADLDEIAAALDAEGVGEGNGPTKP